MYMYMCTIDLFVCINISIISIIVICFVILKLIMLIVRIVIISGTELSGLQWHEALNQVEKSNGIVLDCRNIYETDVGIFDHAKPLNTTFFRESWAALEENLKNVDKHTPILTYCTGGIRCVKINAFLEQKMGFQNTFRLKGGVIAYHRELKRVQAELKRHPSHSDETQQHRPEDAEDRAFIRLRPRCKSR